MYCLMSTIPESNSSPLKITGLKTMFSFLGWPIFRCFVSFRECKSYLDLNHPMWTQEALGDGESFEAVFEAPWEGCRCVLLLIVLVGWLN